MKIVFINNKKSQCGVHEFGIQHATAISKSKIILVTYAEPESGNEFINLVNQITPDHIIFNWHGQTLPWLSSIILDIIKNSIPHVKFHALVHEYPPPLHQFSTLIYNDPDLPVKGCCRTTARIIPKYPIANSPIDSHPVIIGSFGLVSKEKGFLSIIETVNNEFDSALIRLHLPYSTYADPTGTKTNAVVQKCLDLVKPGIKLEITHEYKSQAELVYWLSQHTINCLFTESCNHLGISSSCDFALAANRPIALSNSSLYRHLLLRHPEISITKSTLREIINMGADKFKPLCEKWSEQYVCQQYETILQSS